MLVMIIDHQLCVLEFYLAKLSIVWWLCTPYVFIDASTDQAFEEEEFYQEEEENFNHCTNQGKLLLAS